jgi:hypothetical protein
MKLLERNAVIERSFSAHEIMNTLASPHLIAPGHVQSLTYYTCTCTCTCTCIENATVADDVRLSEDVPFLSLAMRPSAAVSQRRA